MEVEEEITGPRKALALKLAATGSGIGAVTGLAVILAGSKFSKVTGYEESTLVLGLLTIIFSGFALYSAYRSSKETSTDINKRIAWLLGIAIPSIICFFTVGFLWIISGPILFISTGIFIYEMIGDFEKEGERSIAAVPHWKRTAALAGVFVIIIPVVFGGFTKNTELASIEDEDGFYFVRPIDRVEREGNDGNTTSSEVTGVLIVHLILIIGAFTALISGQMGARTITILAGVVLMLALLFFFFFLPNILFIEGARITQFESDHFSSISGGWYMAMLGGIVLTASQFIGTRTDKDKSTERHA